MKRVFICFILLLSFLHISSAIYAQLGQSVSVKMEVRFDGEVTDEQSGFVGRYLKLIVNGEINDRFSYSFRHRLYVDHEDPRSFFNATDWANVTYKANDWFSVTAGKQMICIGTIEYDYAPIDVYFASDFWNHVSPFQVGVNAGFRIGENNRIYAQVTNSPFSDQAMEGLYAYNVIWYGKPADWYNTIWSANMIEYEEGHFINYLALGNKFKFGRTSVDLDYMNRYAGKGTAFFEDFSLHGKVHYDVSEYVSIFAKGGYDVNRSQEADVHFAYDRYVLPGVELGFYGAGVEYFPIKENRQALRLHAFWCSNTSDPVPQTFNIGLRWQMDLLNR